MHNLPTAIFLSIAITECMPKEVHMGEAQDLDCPKINLHEQKEQILYIWVPSKAMLPSFLLLLTLLNTWALLLAHTFDIATT